MYNILSVVVYIHICSKITDSRRITEKVGRYIIMYKYKYACE